MLEQSPEWARDVVLYEVATRSFTSPNGPQSGTFRSAMEKLPLLEELGVNTIWLTGHQLSDPHHFYNIWTQYAVIDPGRIDPVLGTEQDFKAFIDAAHSHHLRVILDVITHGLMADSPIVTEHPHWFRDGTWGMVDFDWQGDHPDLDAWWLGVWLHYVRDFGVDGYRLDVATYRPDLWARLRRSAAELGHKIIIVPENGPAVRGVSDFLQMGDRLSNQCRGVLYEHQAFKDMAGYIGRMSLAEEESYRVKVSFSDGTSMESHACKAEGLYVRTLKPVTEEHEGYRQQLACLQLENLPYGKDIRKVTVTDHMGHDWSTESSLAGDYFVRVEGQLPNTRILFPIRIQSGQLLSIQLSSHDNGWTGFPFQENPFIARGSRFVMGYAFLLSPQVPVMMCGEEFNADFTPIPTLSPDLFGGNEKNGTGKWLYGNMLDWSALPQKMDVWSNTQRMLSIRRAHRNLMHAFAVDEACGIQSVPYTSSVPLPVPYAYCEGKQMLIIIGNPHSAVDATIELELQGWDNAKVRDLYQDEDLGEWQNVGSLTIPRDCKERGGLRVLELINPKADGRRDRETH